MTDATTIESFRAELARTGEEYRLLDRPAGDCALLQFTGRFDGRDVIWNATVTTLARHNWLHAGKDRPGTHRQFIDIAPGDDVMRNIVVGLELDTIDHAVLLKTIIMVRKYKRLHVGRHEFGGAGSGT